VPYLKTCAEFAVYVPYEKDFVKLATTFASVIDAAANQLHETSVKEHLKFQNRLYKQILFLGLKIRCLE
jgi:hypothetical protein